MSEEKGYVAGIRSVSPEDDVIVITDDGVIIRFHADEVNTMSRYASGVKVMRIAEGSKVVTLASTPREEEEDLENLEDVEELENSAAPADGETDALDFSDGLSPAGSLPEAGSRETEDGQKS